MISHYFDHVVLLVFLFFCRANSKVLVEYSESSILGYIPLVAWSTCKSRLRAEFLGNAHQIKDADFILVADEILLGNGLGEQFVVGVHVWNEVFDDAAL